MDQAKIDYHMEWLFHAARVALKQTGPESIENITDDGAPDDELLILLKLKNGGSLCFDKSFERGTVYAACHLDGSFEEFNSILPAWKALDYKS